MTRADLAADVCNATAKRDFTGVCGHAIRAGERCFTYRERALSHHEACHAGTMYPRRFKCAACAKDVPHA